MTIEDEEVPLAPLNELIWKFKRRLSVLTLVSLVSIPAAITSTVIFFVFVSSYGFTSSTGIVFAFLLLSAVASLAAIVVIPDSLSGILSEMETSAKTIAFTIMRPKGGNPQERLLNQLIETDLSIRQLLKRNRSLANLNAEFTGKSGSKYTFDVYIRRKKSIPLKILGFVDAIVMAKRFDQTDPVTKMDVKEFKTQIQDALKSKKVVPTRAILVSTSGFDNSVYEYVGSKEGIFRRRFPNLQSRIELVKENLDSTYDVLYF